MLPKPTFYELDCPPYTSWRQVSGYFDGDGNVGLEVVKRVLRFKIRYVDTWKPQIESIRFFLGKHGLSCGCIGKDDKPGIWQPAYRLDVTETRSVLMTAKAMLRFTVKKRRDLQTLIDYLEGKLTGNEAIAIFNEEVRMGRRRGKIREEDLPFTRKEGLRPSQLENARKARTSYAVRVDDTIEDSIRRDHNDLKLGHIRLSKKYGYSTSVIRRILGAR